MKLYNRIIISRILFTIISFTVFILYFNFFVMSSFKKLEDDFALKRVKEIEETVNEKVEDLYSLNTDWAIWSDSYHFMENQNKEYIHSNLADGAFLTSGADMILFINNRNEIIYKNYYDKENEIEQEIPGLLIPRLKNIEIPLGASGASGILIFNSGALIVARHKIIDEVDTKESNGSLIFASFIKDDFMDELGAILDNKLYHYVIMNTEEIPQPVIKKKKSLALTVKFNGILGEKSYVLTTEIPRSIFTLGKNTVNRIILLLLLVMLTSIMLSSYLLRESVIKSINNLLGEIKEISLKMEKSEQLSVDGTHEFSELKSSINSMLYNLKEAKEDIRRREEKYRTLYEESAALHMVLDDNSIMIDINNAMCKFLELNKEEILGKSIYDFVEEGEKEWLEEFISNVFVGVPNENIDIVFSIDSKTKILHLYPNCLFLSEDQDQFSILITGSDVTERFEMNKKLEELATFDPMTGAYNRRVGLQMLEKRTKHSKRYGNKLSICFIDVNGLKRVNDTFGHNEGDTLIKTSVEVLLDITRDSDIVIRLGGDEFLVILPNCSFEEAEEVWRRVSLVLDDINEYKEDYDISMSHGIVQYEPDKEWTVDEFVEIADKKMYEEKVRSKQARFI